MSQISNLEKTDRAMLDSSMMNMVANLNTQMGAVTD